MGGDISLKSEVGKGTVFTLALPFKRSNKVDEYKGKYSYTGLCFYLCSSLGSDLRGFMKFLGYLGVDYQVIYEEDIPMLDNNKGVLILDISIARRFKDKLSSLKESHSILDAILVLDFGQSIDDELQDFNFILNRPFMLQDITKLIESLISKEKQDKKERFSDEVDLSNKQVLVVEDNEVNLEYLTSLLKIYGVRVIATNNGKDAIEILKKQQVDLVFMDCQMPGIDGFKATKIIRELEQKGQMSSEYTPIVAVTAYALKGDKQRCIDAGMDDYISKPFNADAIKKSIGKVVS